MDQKVFYSKILIDHDERLAYEEHEIPEFQEFDDSIEISITSNFNAIKQEIKDLAEAYSQILDNTEIVGPISDN